MATAGIVNPGAAGHVGHVRLPRPPAMAAGDPQQLRRRPPPGLVWRNLDADPFLPSLSAARGRTTLEEGAPPPPRKKRRRVATAAVDDQPLLLLATVACQVAGEEGEERERMLTSAAGEKTQGGDQVVFATAEEETLEEEDRVDPVNHKLPPTIITPDGIAAAAATGAAALAPAVSAAWQKRKGGGGHDEVTGVTNQNNRPYKRARRSGGWVKELAAQMGWVEKMVRMGGWNPWFVVKKQLSDTDLRAHHSRLPLPVSKDSDPQRGGAEKLAYHLSDSELDDFWNEAGLPVTLLDGRGREYHGGRLRLWRSNGWIVLNGGSVWPRAGRCMGLNAHDVVEVWSFRVLPPKPDAGKLVLVLLGATDPQLDIAAPEEEEEEEEEYYYY